METGLDAIFQQFLPNEQLVTIRPLGGGLINQTFGLEGLHGRYVLQMINPRVFRNAAEVIQNALKITSHLAKSKAYTAQYQILQFFPAVSDSFWVETDGAYWRLMCRVEGQVHEVTQSEKMAYQAGFAFGCFAEALRNLPIDSLKPTISDFHSLEKYLNQYHEACKIASIERLEQAAPLMMQIEKPEEGMLKIEKLAKENMPLRIAHHDAKLSNLLFNTKGRPICVLDLDTTMPGNVLSDIGDLVRSVAVHASEDETDLESITINHKSLSSLLQGYEQGWNGQLSAFEKKYLPSGSLWLVYMQAVRFLTDYLQGDTYYQTQYAGQNLQRAKVQLAIWEKLYGLLT